MDNLNKILATFYERDLRRFIDEINAFKSEKNLWETRGTIKNPAGNLALHINGGLNFFFGTQLAHTGYVRNRDLEFSKKGVPRKELTDQLEEVTSLVTQTVMTLSPQQWEAEFPIPFDDAKNSTAYVLITLLAHIDYHLGQVNYLRRILE